MADERAPEFFCPQCGPLRVEEDGDGRAVSPIEQDGCCRFCGADTVTWPGLCEALAAQGLHIVTDADKAALDACRDTPSGASVREDIAAYLAWVASVEVGSLLAPPGRDIVSWCSHWVTNELDVKWKAELARRESQP
jgi:hypothetical protein